MARKTDILYINYYMSGSTACQLEQRAPKKSVSMPWPKRRRSQKIVIRLDPMVVLGTCVAFVMFILMIAGAVRLAAVQSDVQKMHSYNVSLQSENSQLRQTFEEGLDMDEIRSIAMAQGMIPVEQAKHVSIQVHMPQEEVQLSAWENFWTFLVGLFA